MATQNCNSVLPCSSEKLGDDDLLAEVLIRVPDPKSAYRCKPVCKRWNSLISDPSFNRRFVSHSQSRHERNGHPPPLLLPSDDPESIVSSFLPMPEESTPRSFRVFDSFKDLILCGFLDRENNVDDLSFVGSLFVCNPFTKQWTALPLASETLSYDFVARLVCEPRSNCELEYQFKVACLYQHANVAPKKLHIFCSESGEWSNKVLVLDVPDICLGSVVSSNGRLFLHRFLDCSICEVDVFQRGLNRIRVEAPEPAGNNRGFNISISQGTLHVIRREYVSTSAHVLLTVWRRREEEEENQHRSSSWSKKCEVLLKDASKCDYVRRSGIACLHPENPEIVFLQHYEDANVLYVDLRTEEVGFFAKYSSFWKLFLPRVSCWPTSIPRYEKLRGLYDGSYDCWVQQSSCGSSSQATPPSLPQ